MRWWKWMLLLMTLSGVASGVWYGATQMGFSFQPAAKYRTASVSRGRVEMVVNSSGTIKPEKSVSVGPFVSGPIKELYVDFNSPVKEGDVLAEIDPDLLQAALDRDDATLRTQQAELERIEALLEQAMNNEERALKLRQVNKDYLSDSEMDNFKFTRKSQQAQRILANASISQAIANKKNSLKNLTYAKIRSPANGIVIEKKVEQGQTVASQFQTPELFIIGVNMDQFMHVFASVDEADIGMIHKAQENKQPARLTVDAYPEEVFEAEIIQIRKNSTTTQNVVTYPVVIKVPNRDQKLLPGMTANISFQVEAKEDILRVPVSALRFFPTIFQVHPEDRHHLEGRANNDSEGTPQKSASEKATTARNRLKRLVWVQEGPFLRAVSVTLGLSDSQYAEILEGDLKEGQALVTGVESPFAAAGR